MQGSYNVFLECRRIPVTHPSTNTTTPSEWILDLGLFKIMFDNLLTTFVLNILLYLASFKLARLGACLIGGWLENLILMKTQSSAQTWTLDVDLGFVNNHQYEVSGISVKMN